MTNPRAHSPQPMIDSLTLCRSLLTQPALRDLSLLIDRAYGVFEHADPAQRAAMVDRLSVRGQKFVLTASSLTLGVALSESDWEILFHAIHHSAAAAWIGGKLGPRVAVDLDQAWIRRQYAPGRYPLFHAPHGWHQDGALRFDFLPAPSPPEGEGGLLPMVTVWITLDACGVAAPGLELVTRPLAALLPPGQLTESSVCAGFPAGEFWRPELEPGDALLFDGGVLHRTYVDPRMTLDRTSIELRFFPGDRLPSRLGTDRLTVLAFSPGLVTK